MCYLNQGHTDPDTLDGAPVARGEVATTVDDAGSLDAGTEIVIGPVVGNTNVPGLERQVDFDPVAGRRSLSAMPFRLATLSKISSPFPPSRSRPRPPRFGIHTVSLDNHIGGGHKTCGSPAGVGSIGIDGHAGLIARQCVVVDRERGRRLTFTAGPAVPG